MRALHLLALSVCLASPLALHAAPSGGPRPLQLSAATAPPAKPVHAKLDHALSRLVRDGERGRVDAAARELGIALRGDRVQVTVELLDEAAAPGLLRHLATVDATVTAHYRRWVDLELPWPAVAALARLPAVGQVRRITPVVPLARPGAQASPETRVTAAAGAGARVSQGVALSNADDWQAAGYDGSGTKVAIVDFFQGLAGAQSQGELPPVSVLGTLDTSSPHGTACAEIVHDMAPGAALTVASAASPTDMAAKIVQLAAAGNRVISSSVGFFGDEPGDGSGAVSNAIATARASHGALYVQAAGNSGQRHWDGVQSDPDADQWVNFDGGTEINEVGYLFAGTPVTLFLRWNGWPVTDQDYDLILLRWSSTTGEWLGAAAANSVQNGTQRPVEALFYIAQTSAFYGVAIRRADATGTQTLDLISPSMGFSELVRDRSLVDPATGAASFAVAAADASSLALEPYSSWGPAHGPGGTLAGGAAKPRLTGYANVDTWAYGPGSFNGTSAATPHVAGAAALLLQADPAATAAQLASRLEALAIDLGAAGFDPQHGAGRLHLGPPPQAPGGSITVTLGPPEAVAAGARWRLGGELAWRDSGATATVPQGSWLVQLADAPGWQAPAAYQATVTPAAPHHTSTATYELLVPPPAGPTNLVATPLPPSAIALSWAENAPDEDQIYLDQRIGSGGAWAIHTSFSPDTEAWVDDASGAGLVAGRLYCYRARVHAPAGYSAWSNEACAALPLPAASFHTVTPCRLVDTRATGALAAPATLALAGDCDIPPTATALSLNVTVLRATGPGHVTLSPADSPSNGSTINFAAGATRANNAIVSLAFDGSGAVLVVPAVSGGGSVHLILDVNGYFQE